MSDFPASTGDHAGSGAEPLRQVCAVCGRVLNSYVSPKGERAWLHTLADLPEDHPAVPVPPADGIVPMPRCDFCNAEDPAWELPARSFAIPWISVAGLDHTSHGNWSACDTCASLLARDEWTTLRRRALTASSTSTPASTPASTGDPTRPNHEPRPELEQHLARLYRLLRANITGPIRPFNDQQGGPGRAR